MNTHSTSDFQSDRSSKSVVVTGAGSGIGKAITQLLAKRGYTLVATDIDGAAARSVAEELDCSRGQEHNSYQLDVTDPLGAQKIAEHVARSGEFYGWVNNAGISFMERFLDIPIEQYDKTLDINLKGVFVCGQAAARAMVDSGSQGCIVNIASMGGKHGSFPFLADYVASKFGVVGLTQSMAFELAAHQIRVNSVCPGFVQTPMQERELLWEGELRGMTPEQVRQRSIDNTPLGRLQQPEDVAKAVSFLLSEDASFITGEALMVSGGTFMD